MKSPVACIDVGTHTARLLIARIGDPDQDFQALHRRRITVGLTKGTGRFEEKRISEPATERVLGVMGRFARDIRAHGADPVLAVATGVVRQAENAAEFLERVPIAFARRAGMLGLASDNGVMPVAVSDLTDLECLEVLSRYVGRTVRPVWAPPEAVKAAINHAYQQRPGKVDAVIEKVDGTEAMLELENLSHHEDLLDTAAREVERVRAEHRLISNEFEQNIIHFSAIPWIRFTSVSHPRHFGIRDSIPKITMGKYYHEGDRMMIPVSTHVHHALADGLHVGQFTACLQELFMEKSG